MNQYCFFILSLGIFLISIFSPFFIEGMIYDPLLEIHYENFWPGFIFLQYGYLLNPVITFIWILYRARNILGIDRIRFFHLSLGYMIFLFLYALFLALLPIFWIWVLQKEQILFFFPFIYTLFYTSYRYQFSNLGIGLWKLMVFSFTVFASVLVFYLLKNYLYLLDSRLIGFWSITSPEVFYFFEVVFCICFFYVLYKLIKQSTSLSAWYEDIRSYVNITRDTLPYLSSIDHLNHFLTEKSEKIGVKYVRLIDGDIESLYPSLYKYFIKDEIRNIFLNDRVFLEENKAKFHLENIKEELGDTYLILPIREQGTPIAFLVFGSRQFDYFQDGEIKLFQKLASALKWHLKYLAVYKKMQDLSINLDKRVDEKTIEYNTLVSKQKEFIRYVWHEIKNPITNSLFLCDTLREDSHATGVKDIWEDADILYKELLKVSELIKHIFSTEKFDLDKVVLYKKDVDIRDLFQKEIDSFQVTYSNINFDAHIDNTLGYMEVDEIQFRQVITNIIWNAVKFVQVKNPTISINVSNSNPSWKDMEGKIFISIEDNGPGFNDFESGSIFDKYATGNGTTKGLGMWLYLCKKIIELHGGSISASNSKTLGWACFSIIL